MGQSRGSKSNLKIVVTILTHEYTSKDGFYLISFIYIIFIFTQQTKTTISFLV